jgi:carboxymethylenebutenolidase
MSAIRTDVRQVEVTAADGHRLRCHVFDPPEPPRASVVVLQEIFGVTGHIRRVAAGYRDLGYRAIAPALFDRRERDVELPYDEAGIARGLAIAKSLRWSESVSDVAAALQLAVGPAAAVGYCWGGTVAWVAAARLPALQAAVAYYGGFIPRLLDQRPACPVLLHWAEHDHVVTRADREAAMAAYPELAQHTYDAEHGFNCDERSAWQPAAAALALDRTRAFLAQHLAPPAT